jgi:carbonic anhydrase/acetyltransferase-like protein (isoleucine patch superfamily)
MKARCFAALAAVGLVAFVLPLSAGATVQREGNWPALEKKVDLTYDGPPSEALKDLAHEAGWSLVVQDGVGIDRAGKDVHINVENQRADAVLDALFTGRDIVAHRNGDLITVAAPSTPTAVTHEAHGNAAPFPTARGEDREIVAGDLVVEANEIVHDVTVTAGTADIKGTVTGDLVVTGGNALIHGGAHVVGDATVMGGQLHVMKDAHIDGDCNVTGGSLQRDDGAVIGGRMRGTGDRTHHRAPRAEHDRDDEPAPALERGRSRISAAVDHIGRSLTRASLLFVLGCVLLALLAPQMERLRVEVAARPMRSFATGLVTALVGSIAFAVALALLCITVIGIPVAVGLALALALALYGSVASVLTTFGAAVSGHRTDNPYLHLLVGCGSFLVITCIPWIGGIASAVVMLIALGALVTTRVGGLLQKKRGLLTSPV